jgi:hypothetical protein
MPCSGALKSEVGDADAKEVMAGRRPLRKALTKEQQALFSVHAPAGMSLGDLSVLGPINVLKLKFTPTDFAQRLVAEVWNYPDGGRILELSTKCRRPGTCCPLTTSR